MLSRLRKLDETVRGWKVDLDQQDVSKFWPNNPPHVGEIVLVDDERCRVTSATIAWDGPRWSLLGLRVKAAPLSRVVPLAGAEEGAHDE